jgi:hypothetical protein
MLRPPTLLFKPLWASATTQRLESQRLPAKVNRWRLQEMMEFTREELEDMGSGYDRELFLFASLAEVTPENVLDTPVWRRVGQSGLCELLA